MNTEIEMPSDMASYKPAPIGQLAAALAKFQGEMPSVIKTKTAKVVTKSGAEYKYSYAGLAEVTTAAMPILAKNGLAFICRSEEGERGFILRGMLVHESGETVEGFLPLYGGTNQELGSSLTYGRRYLLGALTGIVTDDDEDGQASVGAEQTKKAPARPRRGKPASSDDAPVEQVEPGPPINADEAWMDKISGASSYSDLTAVYNEADQQGILGHMLGTETVKARLYSKRSELAPKSEESA